MKPAAARHAVQAIRQQGFTLLEITLVLMIIAIATAIVIPNLGLSPAPSLHDEARTLQLALRNAAEEAQAAGQPLRWRTTRQEWRFASLDNEGKWSPIETAALAAHTLPSSVEIRAVRHSGLPLLSMSDPSNGNNDVPPTIGECLFYPDGTLTAADIELTGNSGEPTAKQTLFLRPGSIRIGAAKQ